MLRAQTKVAVVKAERSGFFKKNLIGVYLLYNAMSTSAAQQSESATLDMS